MPAVELRSLAKRFSPDGGVHPISLTVADGESFVLMGPSGSGKTTLLRLIAGLERPDAGELLFDGRPMLREPPHRRQISYVTQRPALYPDLSVAGNLAFALALSPDEIARRVAEAARRLEIASLLDRDVSRLSAGEQQRVALGRLMVRRAPLWLLDEPFANLDPPLRGALSAELHLLRAQFRATMIFVTHEPIEAMAVGQRIGVLEEGRLIQVGPPAEIASHPGSRFVAYCLGETKSPHH